MSGDPKDDLIRKSGSLSLDKKMIENATPFQIQILSALLDQNQIREKTNRVIFEKLDEAALLARNAAAIAESAHNETRGIKTQINEKFDTLNGSVGKAIDRIGKLETTDQERTAEALNQALVRRTEQVISDGVWMIPKPNWKTLTIFGSLVAFIGFDHISSTIQWIGHLFAGK